MVLIVNSLIFLLLDKKLIFMSHATIIVSLISLSLDTQKKNGHYKMRLIDKERKVFSSSEFNEVFFIFLFSLFNSHLVIHLQEILKLIIIKQTDD